MVTRASRKAPPGFQLQITKGRWYCYHRATRIKVDLETFPLGSPEFLGECARIAAEARGTDATRSGPRTFGHAVRLWRARHNPQLLAERTREDYEKIIRHLGHLEDVPMQRFRRPMSRP